MWWADFRKTLKGYSELDVHPHVPEEQARYFRAAAFESTEVEYLDFIFSLIRITKPRSILETGAYHGVSSVCIALALKENEEDGAPRGLLTSIDKEASNVAKAQKLADLWEVANYVRFVRGLSVEYLKSETSPLCYDVAFFDSTRTMRVEEFCLLRDQRRLAPGAVLIFHDTSELGAKSMPDQQDTQKFYLVELEKLRESCRGPIVFRLSRGLTIFQFVGQ